MKNKVILSVLVMVIAMVSGYAQKPKGHQNIRKGQNAWLKELSQEQQDQLKSKHTTYQMAIKADKNKLNELEARKRTLETSDPIDKKALNKCLKSMNDIMTNLHKQKIRHQQDVKTLLSDEQILAYEARHLYANHGFEKGKRQGHRSGQKLGRSQGCYNDRRGEARGQRQMKSGDKKNLHHALDLSEEQQAFIEKSRLELMKAQQVHLNKVNELRAQLKTKTSGKEIDLRSVDKLIDEMAMIRLQMAQNKANHKIEIRNQLSDEQKVIMDMKHTYGRRMARR